MNNKSIKIAKFTGRCIQRWIERDAAGKSAAVSFYTLFSAAPLLYFSLIIAQHFVGLEQAEASAVAWLGGFISTAEAASLVELIHLQVWVGQSFWSTTLIAFILLWATSQVFVRLRIGVRHLFDQQADSFTVALKNGVVGRINALIFSVLSGLLTAAGFVLASILPTFAELAGYGFISENVLLRNIWPALLLTFGGTLLIRWIPKPPPNWSATFRAASFMVIAYTLGRLLLEIYMQHGVIASAYGAASALVVFLVWIYFAAQVFFFATILSFELDALT